jgi:primosomal protein N' (replication factor Y)
MAAVTGHPLAVADVLDAAPLPPAAERLGPVPASERVGDERAERMLVRVPRRDGAALASALKQALAIRSARKSPEPVRVALDPVQVD